MVCPTSLVGNWDNEIRKWVGDRCPTYPVKTDPKRVVQSFLQVSHVTPLISRLTPLISRQSTGKGVLIISYETQRRMSKMFESSSRTARPSCDLLICDEVTHLLLHPSATHFSRRIS